MELVVDEWGLVGTVSQRLLGRGEFCRRPVGVSSRSEGTLVRPKEEGGGVLR